jgi:hypothetical protein
MNDFLIDPSKPNRKRLNAGIAVGLVAAAIMVVVHLFFLLIFNGENRGDLIALGIQLGVYFFASQVAAQRQYNNQERDIEPLRGVRAAGIGAAITTSLLMWCFIILRAIVRDALGIQIDPQTVTVFCMVIVDVLLAIGIGAWGGGIVEKKYKIKSF